ncbi:MAG TPA: amino acid adenylation domain-containing protein [Sporichthyaceae bacterium]|nr:amino acid adenylation domain-containing protein [Sporichthyaceae bacterium]
MTTIDSATEYWTAALLAGGATALPRWVSTPEQAVHTCTVAIPADLAARVTRLAAEVSATVPQVVLAAHTKVLAALSGERSVVSGFVPVTGAAPLPLRLSAEAESWTALIQFTADAQSELMLHHDHPVVALRNQMGVAGPRFESVFDATGGSGTLAEDVVLRVDLDLADELRLHLRHRADALDTAAVARIAGYHLRALELACLDPSGAHESRSLLNAAERTHQLTALAGEDKALPDERFHRLFEANAAAHPDAIAAIEGNRSLTYAQLNADANRIARSLAARGTGTEDVVAVVTERNLRWLTSVLAVFKSGGAYLPIEPHFPSDRIAKTLRRAECKLVLTESESTGTLFPALDAVADITVLHVDDALAEGHDAANLDVAVGPDQLAYIYFTSGSTGEPKGAMCEQAGMLNHLYAKIGDLEIGPESVVAQTAPQCFDISLWQLVSALLVGGRVVLVPQDVILDVARFTETIAASEVTVLQIVPSYLDAVLAHLEANPRELPHLRYVSVTGEAVKKELTQRWFAAMPQIAMLNAYGLTETSDDTNHEVMRTVPEAERVPLGPPVHNVTVYVVDANLEPVPLGAPGEIVFSGVCVGRGYINDPAKTAAAFMPDPHVPGARLYRSGDHGRWRPDGKLEFLGRRDTQVKISGFRIEIGEIENTLLRMPGISDGAVVVAGSGAAQYLVAFYSGPAAIDNDALRAHIAASLPVYMVPKSFHWHEKLPLTGNSKIDRKKLTAEAAQASAPTSAGEAPRSDTERRIAAAWAEVIGVPIAQVSRNDSFFECGGTSLSGVKLVIALNREFSLKELTKTPVLADLARLIDGSQVAIPAGRTDEPSEIVAASRQTLLSDKGL